MAHKVTFCSNGSTLFAVYNNIKYNQSPHNDKKNNCVWICQSYGCNAKLLTKGDEYVGRKGAHRQITHQAWTAEQIIKHQMQQKVVEKATNSQLPPHEAYKSIARDHPQDIKVLSGWRACRNKAYNAKRKSGLVLPKSQLDIASSLRMNGLDDNYYGQKIRFKKYQDNEASSELLNQWKSKVSKLYLGDGGIAEFQVFCERRGAEMLRKANNIHFDVSFKCTPKISPTSDKTLPYKGAMHLIVVIKPPNITQTPAAVPCATILFQEDHCDADTYDMGIKCLRKRCLELFDIEIIDDEKSVTGMGDFEEPLKIAVKRNWIKMRVKGCFFHYSQCLNVNISDKGLKTIYQQNGKNFSFDAYCYIRMFYTLALLPPKLVPVAWNILAKQYQVHIPDKYKDDFLKWLKYHKSYWMKDGNFIQQWNCYRSRIRTNNSLETRNKSINQTFGSHPYLFEFVWKLAKWFADGFVEYDQYDRHGIGNVKHKREVLKEKVLFKLWDFIDDHQSEKDIVNFLSQSSIAMKSCHKKLKQMYTELI